MLKDAFNYIAADPHLRRLALVALGLGSATVMLANATYISASMDHNSQPYSQVPYKMLLENQKGVQLLGGQPVVLKTINFDNANITEQVAKLQLRVKGARRKGIIHTKSTKNDEDEWQLDYAVMRVEAGRHSWNVWLHPDEGVDTDADRVSLERVEGSSHS